jgi:hypothetical protein
MRPLRNCGAMRATEASPSSAMASEGSRCRLLAGIPDILTWPILNSMMFTLETAYVGP